MGITQTAVAVLRDALKKHNRNYAWLSRESGVPYKRLLAEVKHGTSPITLETAVQAGDAFGIQLPELVDRSRSLKAA